MKITFKNKYISRIEADRIIERYYDGLSNAEEEKKLQVFLSQSNLPTKYAAEQAMFGYFTKQKNVRTKNSSNFSIYRVSAAAAAVLLVALFTFRMLQTTQTESFAIVDGVRITNNAELKVLAANSLQTLSGGDEIVADAFQNLSANDIVEQQLEVFAVFAND